MAPRATSACVAALLWLLAAPAHAEPYTIETVGHAQRAEAEAVRDAAAAEGIQATVVRSFRKGQGWVFLVRVQDVQSREQAAATAERLAALGGVSAQVFLVAGRDVLPVEELAVAAPSESDPQAAGADPAAAGPTGDGADARAEGARLVSALVLAHGGGGAERSPTMDQWESVHFRFERSANIGETTMKVWHDYHRVGDAARLELRVLEGEGKDSTTIVKGDQAWLWVDGALHEVGAGPTKEALALFEPAVVLERALGFASWSPELQATEIDAPVPGDGVRWVALERDGGGDAVMVGIDPTDQRARELLLRVDGDELRWTFADYQEVHGGAVVPRRLESSFDGQPRELVTVRSLERPESPDPALFDPELIEKP